VGSEVVRWADRAMFTAVPQESDELKGVMPSVRLLSMTPDPLGTIASILCLAKGEVRGPGDFDREEKLYYWEQSGATHLRAPWEFIEFHFFIDGVPRSWTQQLERQRTATYFEQSLRFAVIEDLDQAVALPASLMGTERPDEDYGYPHDVTAGWSPEDIDRQAQRELWEAAVRSTGDAYRKLIELGMPAEEARDLLPLGTCTRLHYRTSLRGLAEHAGNRLCTQAQWRWKFVFNEIIRAIREYGTDHAGDAWAGLPPEDWQYEVLADSSIFKPVCYSLGRCPWGSDFDRGCKIRPAVEAFAARGVPSRDWAETKITVGGHFEESRTLGPIRTEDWMAEDAARFK
jgi:thymidylate synthase (FAD)